MSENNPFKGFFREGAKINEATTRYVLTDLDEDNLFQVREQTFLEEDGPRKEVAKAAYVLSCGHVVGLHTPREMGGKCEICGGYACFKCTLVCERCAKSICRACAKKVGENLYYCPRCRRIEILKKIGAVFALGLHILLSKEVADDHGQEPVPADRTPYPDGGTGQGG